VALVVFKTGGSLMISQKTNEEWFSMIQECRSSGRTVKEWCQEHAISVNSFYYNTRRLRKLAFTMPVANDRQSVLKKQEIVPLTVTGDEGAIPGYTGHSRPVSSSALSFIIESNGISITCPDGISASTICSVVHALRSGC
jgi:acetylglutamate kinase